MLSFIRILQRSYILKPRLMYQSRSYCAPFDIDGDVVPYGMKTKMDILNECEEVVMFDAYSPQGFKLNNGVRLPGPCAVFPKSALQWKVGGAEHITEESVSLFILLEPKLDLLIIGVGDVDELNKVDPSIIQFIRRHKVNVEILPTVKAISTFNFLNSENRCVAAALIPPKFKSLLEPEPIPTEQFDREIKSNVIREQRQISVSSQRTLSRGSQRLIDKSNSKTEHPENSHKQ